jgi:hypothetical protein
MRTRRETVEHPFGTLKMRMGATHFLMKRLWTSPEKVEGFSDSLSKSGERNDQETDRAKTRFR